MQTLVNILLFIALLLIKIGDSVIYLFTFSLTKLRSLWHHTKHIFLRLSDTIQQLLFTQKKHRQKGMQTVVRQWQLFSHTSAKQRIKTEKLVQKKQQKALSSTHQYKKDVHSALVSFLLATKNSFIHVFSSCKRVLQKSAFTLFAALSFPFRKIPRAFLLVRPQKQPKRIPKKETLYQKRWESYPRKQKKSSLFPFSIPLFVKFKYFVAGVVFSFLFLFTPLLVVVLLQNLPNPKTLAFGQIAQTTKIYDRNGILLYQIYASQNRTVVPLNQVPKHLVQATIAIEDKDFYQHPGFDINGITRSAIQNFSGEGELQGGSTITQQLMKSTLLTPETSYVRKGKEVILAFWAERVYSKNQILEMYFNQVPYGGTAWGVEAAAQVYFGKDVKDLDLAESAFLGGIPRAPTIYSPYSNDTGVWKKRQKEVLDRMFVLEYITKEQQQEALAQQLHFKPAQTPIHAPHFVMYVKDWLVKKYGLPMVEKGGLTVITSLDLKKQELAEEIVKAEVTQSAHLNFTNAAALITNPQNGDILAMVGSKDYFDENDGKVNITTSLRQPGSSIKPITYAAGLLQGMTAATIIDDTPVTYTSPGGPSYSPVNYDGRFHGRVPLRVALANSFNIPAVRTLNQIGVPAMMSLAKKMGIRSWGTADQYGLSLTLGSGEVTMVDMATAYATFANQGVRIDTNPVVKITDAKGYIWEEKVPKPIGTQVLSPGVAFIISDILADNNARTMAFGPNSILQIPGHTVSVKTGTTDYKRDNWTIGYTPDYVVATWVGNNDNTPMSQALASGITGAAPIWNKIMTNLLQGVPDKKFPVPSDVVTKTCYGRLEYFLAGTETSINCSPLPLARPSGKPPTQ